MLKTTTVGSFPKSEELKSARAKVRRGQMDKAQLKALEEKETRDWIRIQEEIGIDIDSKEPAAGNDKGENLSRVAAETQGRIQPYITGFGGQDIEDRLHANGAVGARGGLPAIDHLLGIRFVFRRIQFFVFLAVSPGMRASVPDAAFVGNVLIGHGGLV